MFTFKVFAAIVLALANAAHGVPAPYTKQTSYVNCSAPTVLNLPLSDFLNVTWYLYETNSLADISCDKQTISGNGDSPQHGSFREESKDRYASYPWTSYKDGILIFKVFSDTPPSSLVFQYYSQEPNYKLAVIYSCVNPSYGFKYSSVSIVASENNVPKEEVEALKKQVIAADSSLNESSFKPIQQKDCPKTWHDQQQ